MLDSVCRKYLYVTNIIYVYFENTIVMNYVYISIVVVVFLFFICLRKRVYASYVIFPLLFLVLSVFFYYKHLNKDKIFSSPQAENEITHWKYKIKENRNNTIEFKCEKNSYYTFSSRHGFAHVYIDQKEFEVPRKNVFCVRFPRDVNLKINAYIDGIWSKDGELVIDKNKSPEHEIFFLGVGEYNSDFCLKTSKGVRIKIPSQKELMYLGFFKNNKLQWEELVKRDADYRWWDFWEDGEVKFRSAEKPFLFKPDFGAEKKTGAYYLDAGEEILTRYWVDQGDEVRIDRSNNAERIVCSVNDLNVTPQKEWYGIPSSDYCSLVAPETGYLKMMATKRVAITWVSVERKKSWKFDLKPGQHNEEIEVYEGDQLSVSGGGESGYYVDNKLYESGKDYTFSIDSNEKLKFSASVLPVTVYVKVIRRRYS